MATRIAYQGITGSNSYQASIEMSKDSNLDPNNEYTYIEAISSQGVVDALINDEADYGVMATYNVLVGKVTETLNACDNISYLVLKTHTLPIHHCLFSKTATAELTTIASHIHAISQCRQYITTHHNHIKLQEIPDTAIGAAYLANGKLNEHVGVICRREAGELYHLHLVAENIEDDPANFTTFILIQKM